MWIHTAPPISGSQGASVRYRGLPTNPNVAAQKIAPRRLTCVTLQPDDLITLTAVDGRQTAALWVFDLSGQLAPELLALQGNAQLQENTSRESTKQSIVQRWREALQLEPLLGWCGSHGLKATELGSPQLAFDEHVAAGERFTLKASEGCTVWIGSPLPVSFLTDSCGGELLLEHAPASGVLDTLPTPLGSVREEYRVNRASAKAYEVKAGEYIQVIDVEGQQCSDFMALRADSLHAGVEHIIDSTVTRTMVRGAYPVPGLFDKFYDQTMQPMLAVVQDTVGRHDTFALACTQRGYEERGFPGHVNCSDNISNAFRVHNIAERKAWPAINFFFNSWIDSTDNLIQADEAWSRPGDFVVMRALTDLVCVNTACPDDIDPINGWNPTDIHVRVYDANPTIKTSVAFRRDSETTMTQNSAFHPRTSQLTDAFQPAASFWLPSSYEATRSLEEYWACREAVTIQDMSSLRKLDVQGPDAEQLLQHCLSRDVSKLSVNRAHYALMLAPDGSVIDDGTLLRLSDQVFRWCSSSDDSALQLKQQAEHLKLRVWVHTLSSSMPNLALQGPRSRELLESLVFVQPNQPSLSNLKWFGVTVARVHHRDGAPFVLSRTGFTGELGYEIFCHEQHALEIWDALMEAGAPLGITPMGLEALNLIRLEAGLMVQHAEFGPDIDAFESGLGFAVDLKKAAFIGRDALIRNQAAPRRKLVGLCFPGNDVPQHGDAVFACDADHIQIGVITSAARSPTLDAPIALARVAAEYAEQGGELEVGQLNGRMKRLRATVSAIPFVDPQRTRARA